MKLDSIGNFYVTKGKSVIVEKSKIATAMDVKAILVTTIMGVILNQRELFPIHASAVKYYDKAVVFSGIPGVGKSTLVAGLAKKGFKVITDDIAAVKIIDNKPFIVPSFPSIRLWDDSIKILDLDSDKFTKIRQGVRKRRVVNDKWFCIENAEIEKVFIIKNYNKNEFNITEIMGIAKFNFLKNNTYRLNLIEGKEYYSAFFNQLTILSKNVRLFEINKPKEIKDSGELIDLILKTISEN